MDGRDRKRSERCETKRRDLLNDTVGLINCIYGRRRSEMPVPSRQF